jgi:hypothetical protein
VIISDIRGTEIRVSAPCREDEEIEDRAARV